MSLSDESLSNYYTLTSALTEHNMTLSEMENMIPFEHSIYVSLLSERIKKRKEAQEKGN